MDSKRPLILVADDEQNIRSTISHALHIEGYDVVTAVDGQDTLLQLRAAEFDLLLLDLRMPGMDGMEVLRQVVELYPNVPVVIITAYGTVETAVEAVKLGAVDFIQKPFSPKEIRTLVAEVLDRGHTLALQEHDYATHLELARRSIHEKRLAAAKEHVRHAIAKDPGCPDAFNLLGVLEEMAGNHHAALVNYRIALDLDPTYAPALTNLQKSSNLAGRRPSSFDLG